MPTKRRIGKTRGLSDGKIEELLRGPGTHLLAGCGYWAGAFFWNLPADGQVQVLAEMRDDWERHSAVILAAWQNRSALPSDPAEPWALTEFGTHADGSHLADLDGQR